MGVQTPIAVVQVTSFLSQDPGDIKTVRRRRCSQASVLLRVTIAPPHGTSA